jgi:Acetyltransferase (GNAT) domain
MTQSISRPRIRALLGGTARAPAPVLRLPQGYSLRSLSDSGSRHAVSRWLLNSPDHTLYHLGPYIDFLRAQNGVADVSLISRDGNALFALTIHSWDAVGIDSGYSGVVFPATRSERVLRRSVAGLAALFAANRQLPFHLRQSAQAPAYDDPGRVTLLQQLLESEGLTLDPVYSRVCDLGYLPRADEIPIAPAHGSYASAIGRDWLTGEALNAYDPGARNQIRRAVRDGFSVEYVCSDDPTIRADAYARFQLLHEESWLRTGLLPKTLEHWHKLSESIAASGGKDLIVLTLDPEGKPLAGVVCHTYQARAAYWSGCSSARGLASRANPLCLHGAILACRREGVLNFELGRFHAEESSQKERSVTGYKAQFGGSLVRITSFSSAPSLLARARAARAGATFEARRRLSLALARRRLRSPHQG